MNFIQICLKPDKKIKKNCRPASTKKDYFRILWPTQTINNPGAANTNVASGPAGPDAKAAPTVVPPLEETMTARMLKRLVVASATISLSLRRLGNHRHPEILPWGVIPQLLREGMVRRREAPLLQKYPDTKNSFV